MYFNFDKRYLYIVIAIMVLWGLSSYLSNPSALLGLLYTIPGILIAITFHEFAHAKAADMFGDDTPRLDGRLTLNPLAHIDPVGFIMLLFTHIGWGKPVRVNPRNYNRDISIEPVSIKSRKNKRYLSMEKADCLVSLAGPVMNFILAIIFTIIYFLILKYLGTSTNPALKIIAQMIKYTVILNVGLGVFNLIPLPPLNGSKIIKPILPQKAKMFFEDNQTIFYIIFVALWITGIAGNIISPLINVITNWLFQLGSFIL